MLLFWFCSFVVKVHIPKTKVVHCMNLVCDVWPQIIWQGPSSQCCCCFHNTNDSTHFFPVPFIHSMAWSGSTCLKVLVYRLTTKYPSKLWWHGLGGKLVDFSYLYCTPSCIVQVILPLEVWQHLAEWVKMEGSKYHRTELEWTATALRSCPCTATRRRSSHPPTYFEQNLSEAYGTIPASEILLVLVLIHAYHRRVLWKAQLTIIMCFRERNERKVVINSRHRACRVSLWALIPMLYAFPASTSSTVPAPNSPLSIHTSPNPDPSTWSPIALRKFIEL